MGEWREKTLGELTSYIAKGIPPKYVEEVGPETISVLNQKCNRNYRISYSEARLHDNSAKKAPSDKMLRDFDVLINSTGTGTAGRVAQIWHVSEPTTLDGHMILMRPTEEIDPLYYGYAIKAFQAQVESFAEGSTGQTEINKRRLQDEIVIRFPVSLNEQRAVGRMLKAIDEKIQNNEEINKNLEEQAQAIFAAFISDHQTTTVTVEDVVLTANTGADAIRKAPIVDRDTGVRCVRVGDMSNKRPVHEWGFAQVTPEIFKQYQLHKNDIVVTRTASLGLNRLIGEDLSAVYNNGLIRISINQDIVYPLIVYRQFQTDDYRNYISRISGETSVRPNMKINYLLKYSFDIPSLSDQAELISILQPIFETQEINMSENQALSSLRDTLLPKLMFREIDVSELAL